MRGRLLAMLLKEFRQLGADWPIVLILLWGFFGAVYLSGHAGAVDLSNYPVVVLDLSHSNESRELVSRLRAPYFKIVRMVHSDHLIKTIAEAGVNVEAIKRTSLHPTSTYLGVVNSGGELQVALDDMRAMTLLSPDYLRENESLFRQAALLFLDANLPNESLRTAMSLAKAARLPVCADPTSSGLAVKLKPYLKKLRMLTPNSAEAAILTDQAFNTTRRREALQAAKHLVSQGVEIVIVAMAAFGVCYATSETSGYIPAIRTEIIDPTGAGDAMTATVLFALLNDMPIDDAVRLGVSAASLTLRHRGTVVPDLSLEALYNELV